MRPNSVETQKKNARADGDLPLGADTEVLPSGSGGEVGIAIVAPPPSPAHDESVVTPGPHGVSIERQCRILALESGESRRFKCLNFKMIFTRVWRSVPIYRKDKNHVAHKLCDQATSTIARMQQLCAVSCCHCVLGATMQKFFKIVEYNQNIINTVLKNCKHCQ